MKKIYTVTEKPSGLSLRVMDSVGRETVLQTDKVFNVGDSVLVINGVIVGRVKKEAVQVFEV